MNTSKYKPTAPPMQDDLDLEQRINARLNAARRERTLDREPLYSFGVRNDQWRYNATSTYEQLFWQPFLGTRRFALWQTLRAYNAVGMPRPSLRFLSTMLTGTTGNTSVIQRDLNALYAANVAAADGRVHEVLPLLTPAQVDTLSPAIQALHTQFLENYYPRRRLFFEWQQCDADTLVTEPPAPTEKVITFHRKKKKKLSTASQ